MENGDESLKGPPASKTPGHQLPGGPLTPADEDSLATTAWITPELAKQARLRRVNGAEGAKLLGYGGKHPGITCPNIWPGEHTIRQWRLKLDEGGTIRRRKGSRNLLYITPGTSRQLLEDVQVPVVIAESEEETLALYRLAKHGEVQVPRFLPVGLYGPWNWKGRVEGASIAAGEKRATAPIPDLDRIVWESRCVFVFDRGKSDESLWKARKALAAELERRGARVEFRKLQEIQGTGGVHELLAKGGAENVLPQFDTSRQPEKRGRKTSGSEYEARSDGLFELKKSPDGKGEHAEQLTNFSARIIADIIRDNGLTSSRVFKICSTIHGRQVVFEVPADQFNAMNWPIQQIGAEAIVLPGRPQPARTAIQFISGTIPQQRVFTHTGWQEYEGKQIFLHAGGAIGPNGSVPEVEVDLPDSLRNFRLPQLGPNELRSAIEGVVRLRDALPPRIVYPMLAAAFRAPLGSSGFSLGVFGHTGYGKTVCSALFQQFFGPEMDSEHLAAGWVSTPNALEAIAFSAKDVLLVIDDFVPQGSVTDIQQQHGGADRLLRGQANHTGRSRMNPDSSLQQQMAPRGLIITTGEEVPSGQSLQARMVIIQFGKDDMNWNAVSGCQADARRGLFAQVMAGYIRYLAEDPERMVKLRGRLSEVRKRFESASTHKRIVNNLADLFVGLEGFFDFAQQIDAIEPADAARLRSEAFGAFTSLAEVQQQQQDIAEPTTRFIAFLAAAISSGRAHVAARNGDPPDDPQLWGWRGEQPQPQGRRVGWLDKDDLYLNPEAAHAEVHLLARDSGTTFPISDTMLRRQLNARGWLVSTDSKRQVVSVRKTVDGKRMEVLHLSASAFLARDSDAKVGSRSGPVPDQPARETCGGDADEKAA